MHKRLYTSLTAVTALVLSVVLMVPAFGAVKEQAVDTILLEPETLWEDEVPVDLSWKTQQDKGRWIDEMGIAGDSKSLILVINNLEMESSEEIPVQTRNGKNWPSPPAVSWLGIPASSIIPDVRTEAGERFLPSTAIFPEALERTRIFTAYTGWTVPLAWKAIREAWFPTAS